MQVCRFLGRRSFLQAATVQAAVRGNLSRQASKQKLESQKSIGDSIAEGISNLFAPAPADAATETGAPGTAERRGSKSLLETIGTSLSEVTANIAEGVQSLFGDPVASRITIVPIKPKSQAAILATTATLLQNWQVKTKAAETLPGAENCTLRVGSRVHMQMQPGQWAAGSVKGAFMSGEVYVKFDDGSEWQGPSTNCAPYKYGRGGPLG